MLVLASRPNDSRRRTADRLGPDRAGPSLEGRLERPCWWPLASPPLAGRECGWRSTWRLCPADRDQPPVTKLPLIWVPETVFTVRKRSGWNGPNLIKQNFFKDWNGIDEQLQQWRKLLIYTTAKVSQLRFCIELQGCSVFLYILHLQA